MHDCIIDTYGGSRGVLFEATLEHLIYEVNKKNHVCRTAALVLHMIITNHPFIDGNKRTALNMANLYLESKGVQITASKEDMKEFVLKIAMYGMNKKEIEKWLRENTRKL